MSRRQPPILTGGATRRRRRSRAAERRRRRLRPLVAIVVAAFVLVALSALLEPVIVHESESPPPAAHRLSPPDASAVSKAPTVDDRYAVDLSRPDTVAIAFHHKPRAGLLFDLRSGRALWRWKPQRRLAIASLTKMMTALLVVEREDAHDRVRISRRAVKTAGSGVGVLPKGKKVQLEALLNGLLLVSGNDAAVALAEHSGGSVPGFVRLMNRRARELGLRCSHFTSPHGLLDHGNRSCAADLGALARADMAQRRIRRVVRRSRAIVKFPIKGGKLFLYNNNPLIKLRYPGITGLKTGYTDRAGRSIVATAKRGRVELGVVLLHSPDPAPQAAKLLNRGFKALR
jgi:serine-type D-Ala-D-Ala carboxypeptidase (penicillin-binding protein 5/6)